MEEIYVNADELDWDRVPGWPVGIRRKVLRLGADGKPRAALLRLDPGIELGGHSHDLVEQHYVIEGAYESQGREFRAGAYRLIPRHAPHGPFRSAGGALVLAVWHD